jgi:hypothetical protein
MKTNKGGRKKRPKTVSPLFLISGPVFFFFLYVFILCHFASAHSQLLFLHTFAWRMLDYRIPLFLAFFVCLLPSASYRLL